MKITKKKAITYLLLTMSFVYIWILILSDFELLKVRSTSLFPIVVGLFSLVWVYQTSEVLKGKDKYIWKIISIGLAFHITGNFMVYWC